MTQSHPSSFDGRLRLTLVQPAPRADTDTVAFDRELMLTFSESIAAADVDASILEGLDTDS